MTEKIPATTGAGAEAPGTERWLFLAKTVTAGSGIAFGLIQTFVFSRILGLDLFGHYVLIGAVGMYLVVLDFGLTKVLYVEARQGYLAGDPGRAGDLVGCALAADFVIAGLAGLGFALVLAAQGLAVAELLPRLGYFLFFVLQLPWTVMGTVAGATGRVLAFELIDAGRRLAVIAVTLGLLAGLGFSSFILAINLIWLAALAVTLGMLRRALGLRRWRDLDVRAGGRALFGRHAHQWRGNFLFALADYVIFTFPFLVIPAMFGGGARLVVFDIYFKIVRAAGLLFRIPGETLLPRQTAAYFTGDMALLRRLVRRMILVCLVPAVAIAGLLTVGGQPFFALLFGQGGVVPVAVVAAIILHILGTMIHTALGQPLLHTGHARPLARLSLAVLAAMAAMSVAVVLTGAGLVHFLQLYSVIYTSGAAAQIFLARRLLGQKAG